MKGCGFQFDTTYMALPSQLFTKGRPDQAPSPKIVMLNSALATSMGLTFSHLTKKEQAELFSGSRLPKGAEPFSQAYAGHQFGYFNILGDGRAHVWGEHLGPDGERYDIQSKGSGRTPYSRGGDGKATLGPMLREYLISEAMHHLKIPTTRSLAVVTTGEPILREELLPGALLTRVASSHLRVGTFSFAANKLGEKVAEKLIDYTIERHYPALIGSRNKALALLEMVMDKQAELITHWMRVGFIHGVMNTDNMSLSGETLDYGPCAFMDTYDPHTVFSSIDDLGRYAYANQPKIAQWNLARLAEALLPWIDHNTSHATHLATEIIEQFPKIYHKKWLTMMRSKLGLFGEQKSDEPLIVDLLDWLNNNHADYTNTFWDISQKAQPIGGLYAGKSFQAWYLRWQDRRKQNRKPLQSSIDLMQKNNPALIPRNHRVEQALQAAHAGSFTPFKQLLAALEKPYEDRALFRAYRAPPSPSERVYQTFCGT
ncbi:MAG: YdiU family protein [Chlamydiota bacterium]